MQLDEIIAVTFEPQLSALGFTRGSARRWVRESKSPVREIFRLQAMKGATYSSAWGFDLTYVPLFRSGSFRSKRTLKACDFDLTIDPIDEATEIPAWCSFGWL